MAFALVILLSPHGASSPLGIESAWKEVLVLQRIQVLTKQSFLKEFTLQVSHCC